MNTIIAILISILLNFGLYPSTMVVTDLDYENDQVIFQTATGFEYRNYDGIEDQEIGDLFGMIMWDNNTPEDISDDIIIWGHYSGFNVTNY